MEELVELIQGNPDPRELKRALAVKMVVEGYLYRLEEVLQVSDSNVAQMVASVCARRCQGSKIGRQRLEQLPRPCSTTSSTRVVAAKELLEFRRTTAVSRIHLLCELQVPSELLRIIF